MFKVVVFFQNLTVFDISKKKIRNVINYQPMKHLFFVMFNPLKSYKILKINIKMLVFFEMMTYSWPKCRNTSYFFYFLLRINGGMFECLKTCEQAGVKHFGDVTAILILPTLFLVWNRAENVNLKVL